MTDRALLHKGCWSSMVIVMLLLDEFRLLASRHNSYGTKGRDLMLLLVWTQVPKWQSPC